MKKQLISKMAILSAMMIATSAAFADPILIISDGTTNTGPITLTGGGGQYINGSFDSTWDFVITTGQSKPALGSADSPNMELSITADSLGSGSDLTIIFSDNNFGPTTGNLTANFIGHPFNNGTGDAISFDTYYDVNNVLAALSTPITSADGMTPDASNTYQSVKTGSIALPVGYSLTEVVTIKGGQVSSYSLSANLQGTNQAPSCNCKLTFCSPPSLTLCAADTIPDVVAAQVCDGGLSNTVPVVFLGAVTNGSCPTIITRTNGATDSCGTPYTFIQTITINCLGNICGHVFADCDASGDLTKGDVGLSKVTVSLLNSNKVVKTLTTDANGGYCFTNLLGGNYTVSVTAPSGYSQTAASTSYHWKDTYGRTCWQENDGYIHCLSSGTECWWDKSNCCHWKDSYGRDCWKDNWGSTHCQPCSYQSCNAQTNNNKLTLTLTNCTSQTDVDFAYTGSKSCLAVSVCAPSYVKCGQSCSFTCTITNTGNACFTGGTVCHQIGNCGGYGGWNNCQNVYDNCPPLSPGQSCTFTHKCTFGYQNCGTVGCQSTVNCNSHNGNYSCQSSCYSQCGW